MRTKKTEFFAAWTNQEVSDVKDAIHKAISELGPRSFLRRRLVRYLRWFELEENKRRDNKNVSLRTRTNKVSA